VQLAKHLGAHVISTCSSHNVDFVRYLGRPFFLLLCSDLTLAVRVLLDIFGCCCIYLFVTLIAILTRCGLGADQIIDYKSTDFETELKGHEVDAVFDTIGGDTLNKVCAFSVVPPLRRPYLLVS